ncbi:MAG TPA: type II toxin-antitoxin system PemK/MazF family toxin [Clostridiales bacterium]|nr:type II toxin-antitoxin system PemK/MazF family toxin [Clostridiales bacterium]
MEEIKIELSIVQKYLEWLKTKLYLHLKADNASRRAVKRGEVYKCSLGEGIGSEQCKERPCVILQSNAGNAKSPNTIVAPITHTTSTLQIVVPIADKRNLNGDVILDGNVLLGNIICVSKARLGEYVAKLEPKESKILLFEYNNSK